MTTEHSELWVRAESIRRYPYGVTEMDAYEADIKREAFIAGAEWKGAQVKIALIELRDYFHRHGLLQQEAIVIRALSGVESSDEGEALYDPPTPTRTGGDEE